MKNNKKGLSTVITTLVIILLVLVAVGIIWVVIRNVVEEGSEEVSKGAECINLKTKIFENSFNCNGGYTECNVTVQRLSGGDKMRSIKVSAINNGGVIMTGNTSEASNTIIGVLDAKSITLTGNGAFTAGEEITITSAGSLEDGRYCDPSDEEIVTVPTP